MNANDDSRFKMLAVRFITGTLTVKDEPEFLRLKAAFEKEQADAARKSGLGKRGGKGRKGPHPEKDSKG